MAKLGRVISSIPEVIKIQVPTHTTICSDARRPLTRQSDIKYSLLFILIHTYSLKSIWKTLAVAAIYKNFFKRPELKEN